MASFVRFHGSQRPQNPTTTANSPKGPSSLQTPPPGLAGRTASHLPSNRITTRSGAPRCVPLPGREATPGLGQPGAPTTRWGVDFLGPPGSPPPLPLDARLHLHHPESRSPPPRNCAKSSPSLVSGEFRGVSRPSLPALERTAIPRPPKLGEEPCPGGPVGSQSFCKWHLELAASQRIFT